MELGLLAARRATPQRRVGVPEIDYRAVEPHQRRAAPVHCVLLEEAKALAHARLLTCVDQEH